jgi:two-component system, OmpR family, KDP operon response regulator KdpE
MLRAGLQDRYEIEYAADWSRAVSRVADFRPDLIILDMLLPGMHGLKLCRVLRDMSGAPVCVVSGVTDTRTKVLALEGGADDYVTKPFDLEELRARLDAIRRRAGPGDARQEHYDDGTLSVDLQEKHVLKDGRDVELTVTEFRLLECLVGHMGRVVTHQELLQEVWGDGYEGATPCLHVYIHYLRHKVEPDPKLPRYIVSLKAQGYLFHPRYLSMAGFSTNALAAGA